MTEESEEQLQMDTPEEEQLFSDGAEEIQPEEEVLSDGTESDTELAGTPRVILSSGLQCPIMAAEYIFPIGTRE